MANPDALPRMAERFLRKQPDRRAERIIRRFHGWLRSKHMAVSALSPDDLGRFFKQPFRKIVSPRTARQYKLGIIDYLKWLYELGYLDFDPHRLDINKIRPLPAIAEKFIQALEPTHRLSTRNCYATMLRRFHAWLDDARLSLRRLRRTHIEQWCLALNDKGLHPSTRRSEIGQLRAYLRWLFERGELRTNPDDLVRSSDFPKLPIYLPRPLPPDVDVKLQRRLRSSHWLHKAFLVMRHTGLRIGELQHLAYDCIRRDQKERSFLKVPLGKLHNERLVPLTSDIVQLIDAIRAHGQPNRSYLLAWKHADKPISQGELRRVFRRAIDGLETSEPIVTHRLRHTYATSMLNAGMSLVSVMKLLGHRDYRMTLRYAAITQPTITREYEQAIHKLRSDYPALPSGSHRDEDRFHPVETIDRLLAWTQNNLSRQPEHVRAARSLSKRLRRIRSQISTLLEQR